MLGESPQVGSPEASEVSISDMNDYDGKVDVSIGEDTVQNVPEKAIWKWNESVVGEGEKPKWIDDKYRTVEEQAKANVEAQKYIGHLKQKLGQFAEWQAPKEYDFKDVIPEGSVLDQNKVSKFTSYLRDKGIPQSIASDLMKMYIVDNQSKQIDMVAEKEKLGQNADEQLKNMTNWVANNFHKDTQKYIFENVKTAEGVKALKDIRDKMQQTSIDARLETVMPGKTKQTVLDYWKENLYSGEMFAKNPDKANDYVKANADYFD